MARTATAEWKGDLMGGSGHVALGSGAFEGAYSFATRFGEETGANPEELLGAANAACFSMALANSLAKAGFTATSVATTASVHLGKDEAGFKITRIDLDCTATVPGVDASTFATHAEQAKSGCIISRALAATDITLKATLA
ncbi:MAG: OsmC family peroxiredoxin [Acidobacteria bacterium]|nr:OsmC family peroxiredoxin [Acidobacteriota bacterium]